MIGWPDPRSTTALQGQCFSFPMTTFMLAMQGLLIDIGNACDTILA
jgi:hypothetical protein